MGGLAGQAHVTVVPGSVQRLVITPGAVELASTTTQEFTVTGLMRVAMPSQCPPTGL